MLYNAHSLIRNSCLATLLLFSGFLFSGCHQQTQVTTDEKRLTPPHIIPKPASLTVQDGAFVIDLNTVFVLPHDSLEQYTQSFTQRFQQAAGFPLQSANNSVVTNSIVLEHNDAFDAEEYLLDVNRNQIILQASQSNGFVYGLETLRQLLPIAIEKNNSSNKQAWKIPAVTIRDKPAYAWRGLMLDVSRHFFDVEYVKKTIDRMAMLKLNTFHFHLIDDQGWRIEIKKYPKLTEVGAFRVDQEDKHWNNREENDPSEKGTYGGYYTQEDIREIVAYAHQRGITVVPEIEMPAHVTSAIAAYPWLSCHEQPVAVPSGGLWPITDIYCAGKESTFTFLEDVLIEVMDLFPSEYIHVGGDEATKTEWEQCDACQQRMQQEGLESVEELQSYFMKRMEGFLNKHNRKLIGWDEILEGGLPKQAAVMSWRGMKGGLEASEQGHNVVMTPTDPLYFDYYQGRPENEPLAFGGINTVEEVYAFSPVVDSMTTEQAKHVLGAQANLWSEYIPTTSHSEYMLFPRLLALSETVWTPKEEKNWQDFATRLEQFFPRLDAMDINYATTVYNVNPSIEKRFDENQLTLSLSSSLLNKQLFFTTSDSLTDSNAIPYQKPLIIDTTTTITAAVMSNGYVLGTPFQETYTFHKAVGKRVKYHTPYHQQYTGGGKMGLVDVIRGSADFGDGRWQGWLNKPASVEIMFDEPKIISSVHVGFLEQQGSAIYFPSAVSLYFSFDGEHFQLANRLTWEYQERVETEIRDMVFDLESTVEVKAIRIKTEGVNDHVDGGAWTFLDEIVVE